MDTPPPNARSVGQRSLCTRINAAEFPLRRCVKRGMALKGPSIRFAQVRICGVRQDDGDSLPPRPPLRRKRSSTTSNGAELQCLRVHVGKHRVTSCSPRMARKSLPPHRLVSGHRSWERWAPEPRRPDSNWAITPSGHVWPPWRSRRRLTTWQPSTAPRRGDAALAGRHEFRLGDRTAPSRRRRCIQRCRRSGAPSPRTAPPARS